MQYRHEGSAWSSGRFDWSISGDGDAHLGASADGQLQLAATVAVAAVVCVHEKNVEYEEQKGKRKFVSVLQAGAHYTADYESSMASASAKRLNNKGTWKIANG